MDICYKMILDYQNRCSFDAEFIYTVLFSDALSCNLQIVNKMGLKFQQNLLKVDTNIVLFQNLVDDTFLQI